MSQSLDRALSIMAACASEPQSLGELAALVDVHRSTVLRLLQTMEARGFMRRSIDGGWQVGSTLLALSAHATERLDLRQLARPWMLRLSRELGHTIHLAERIGTEVIYVDKEEGRGAVRLMSRIGAPAVVHTAGVAKAVLAWSSSTLRDDVIATADFARYSDATITDPASYRVALETAYARGWAIDDGEHEDFLSCVAVPIFDATGDARGAISVTALHAIEPLAQLERHVPLLQKAARDISLTLGWQEPDA